MNKHFKINTQTKGYGPSLIVSPVEFNAHTNLQDILKLSDMFREIGKLSCWGGNTSNEKEKYLLFEFPICDSSAIEKATKILLDNGYTQNQHWMES